MIVEPDERTFLARERTVLANERNRLANERTFLAWTRTGLASVAGGLAVVRFLTFHTFTHQITSQLVGCALVLLGIAIFTLSFIDYKNSCKKLSVENGYAGSVVSIGAMSIVLISVSVILLFFAFRFSPILLG